MSLYSWCWGLKSRFRFINIKWITGLFIMCGALVFLSRTTHIFINKSNSLPYKVFLVLKGVKPALGDCVAFHMTYQFSGHTHLEHSGVLPSLACVAEEGVFALGVLDLDVPDPGVPVIKRVVGREGDIVRHVHQGKSFSDPGVPEIWVGETKVGIPLKETLAGTPLTPLVFKGVIPAGYLFVAGSHERSFDSRYEEVGLIHERHIIGKAIPLF